LFFRPNPVWFSRQQRRIAEKFELPAAGAQATITTWGFVFV
jgi:hypothetical protein